MLTVIKILVLVWFLYQIIFNTKLGDYIINKLVLFANYMVKKAVALHEKNDALRKEKNELMEQIKKLQDLRDAANNK